MHQQIELFLRKELPHSLGRLLHAPVICKKHERAAIGLLDKMRDPMFQRFPVGSLPWIGHFLHDEYPHLFLEIERTPEQHRLNFARPDALPEIGEIRATH